MLSPYDALYFDCGTGNLLGEAMWCSPYITWIDILNINISMGNLTKSQVLGAEAWYIFYLYCI